MRNGIDDVCYRIRFTPRKAGSIWSAVNIKRVAELSEMGLMQPAGFRAFEKRIEAKSGIYAYEQREVSALGDAYEQQFHANAEAWAFFQARPAGYRKTAIWWVVSAKQEASGLPRSSKTRRRGALSHL